MEYWKLPDTLETDPKKIRKISIITLWAGLFLSLWMYTMDEKDMPFIVMVYYNIALLYSIPYLIKAIIYPQKISELNKSNRRVEEYEQIKKSMPVFASLLFSLSIILLLFEDALQALSRTHQWIIITLGLFIIIFSSYKAFKKS